MKFIADSSFKAVKAVYDKRMCNSIFLPKMRHKVIIEMEK